MQSESEYLLVNADHNNSHPITNFLLQKIPTDGLVLKGWYTTITLAIYGVLSKANQPAVPVVPIPERHTTDLSSNAATADWVQQHAQLAERPQENMYIDQSYPYSSDYQSGNQEHYNVEEWPIGSVPTNAVVSVMKLLMLK